MQKKTKAIMIRIPNEIADGIDEANETYGLYSNKPDFILTGMRNFLDDLSLPVYEYLYSVESGEEDYLERTPEKAKEEVRFHVEHKNDAARYLLDYKNFQGKTKAITLYIPKGMIERIEIVCTHLKYGLNLSDFIKASIMYAIEKYEDDVEEMENLVKNKEEIADTIKNYSLYFEKTNKS